MKGGFSKWKNQCRLLLWKNYRLCRRNVRGTVIQLCIPAIFILILFVIQEALRSSFGNEGLALNIRSQGEDTINDIPLCSPGPEYDQCWTLFFTPNNSTEVNEIMRLIRTNNDPVIPEDSIRGFSTASEMDKSPSKMSLITPNEIEMDSKQERKEESKEEKKESTSSEDSSSSTSSSAED
eukprot:TRINITY_DN2698_c0_g1_i1.p1 TRINITY_DN2698_c0_g1~~TRINITY_DN2698_c0_g1_i1.p1  ORF type:complete len:180 (+),score=54.47 TRINITY_DN2698_c0_g1_i1:62-601(+)